MVMLHAYHWPHDIPKRPTYIFMHTFIVRIPKVWCACTNDSSSRSTLQPKLNNNTPYLLIYLSSLIHPKAILNLLQLTTTGFEFWFSAYIYIKWDCIYCILNIYFLIYYPFIAHYLFAAPIPILTCVCDSYHVLYVFILFSESLLVWFCWLKVIWYLKIHLFENTFINKLVCLLEYQEYIFIFFKENFSLLKVKG